MTRKTLIKTLSVVKWGLGVSLLLAFLGFIVYDFAVNGPKAAKFEKQLRDEFRPLQPPPGTVVVREDTGHGPGMARAGATYRSALSRPELTAYYDALLAEHGWQFMREEARRDWGRDLGGLGRLYRKDDFTADFEYAGSNNDSWEYALDLIWCPGMDRGMPLWGKVVNFLWLAFFAVMGALLLFRPKRFQRMWIKRWQYFGLAHDPIRPDSHLTSIRLTGAVLLIGCLFFLFLFSWALWRGEPPSQP